MQVVHLSAECYPVAKVGGLGDVVGALPKYQNSLGIQASVVMPYYKKKFISENHFDSIFEGSLALGTTLFNFKVLKETTDKLGFPLFLIYISGLLDREEIYSYPDETEQFIAFQLAFLEWASQLKKKPDIVHCHDHHTGLIPFLMYHSRRYKKLAHIPTVVTVHNAEYQGWFGWDKLSYLPDIDLSKTGLLDWNGTINPLAAAIKCCWRFTAVSPTYLEELSYNSNGLEYLFAGEKQKGVGIINGIDTDIWNPETDSMLMSNYTTKTAKKGKLENKRWISKEFGFAVTKPLIAFIGRLVGEKGADLLPQVILNCITELHSKVNILILGSGLADIEDELTILSKKHKKQFNCFIGYNETLSHRIYASADFILMPSRIEPCGLNQLYALRYGTIPIVRNTGGLKDTVIDYEIDANGYGICFNDTNIKSIMEAIHRAVTSYQSPSQLQLLRTRMMALDFSWSKSANHYVNLYKNLIIKT